MKNGKANIIDLMRVVLRLFLVQSAFNNEKMLNFGFAFSVLPLLKKFYPAKDDLCRAVSRHLDFFNTHPYMVSFIAGVVGNLEERSVRGEISEQEINKVKSGIMGPLAAIGDSIFWVALKPLFACIAVVFCFCCGIAGVVIMLAGYNFAHIFTRVVGVLEGYRAGIEIQRFLRIISVKRILHVATIGSLLIIGILVTFSLFKNGGFMTGFYLKGLLSILIVLSVYLLRKNVNPMLIFAGMIALSMTLGFFGFEKIVGETVWFQKQ